MMEMDSGGLINTLKICFLNVQRHLPRGTKIIHL